MNNLYNLLKIYCNCEKDNYFTKTFLQRILQLIYKKSVAITSVTIRPNYIHKETPNKAKMTRDHEPEVTENNANPQPTSTSEEPLLQNKTQVGDTSINIINHEGDNNKSEKVKEKSEKIKFIELTICSYKDIIDNNLIVNERNDTNIKQNQRHPKKNYTERLVTEVIKIARKYENKVLQIFGGLINWKNEDINSILSRAQHIIITKSVEKKASKLAQDLNDLKDLQEKRYFEQNQKFDNFQSLLTDLMSKSYYYHTKR